MRIKRLRRWYRPGFIAIGDAAHAMSPMFGVGVNYAIQDAVALANATTDDLAAGRVPVERLAAVQQRRERPVTTMQRVQRAGHRLVARSANGSRVAPGWAVTLLARASPWLRPHAARFVGIGLLPEHAGEPLRHRAQARQPSRQTPPAR